MLLAILLIFSFLNDCTSEPRILAQINIEPALIDVYAKSIGFEIERRLQSYPNVYVGTLRRRKKRSVEDDIVEQLIASEHSFNVIEVVNDFQRFQRAHPTGALAQHIWEVSPSMNLLEASRRARVSNSTIVAIVDDGIDVNHVDLHESLLAEASFDFIGASDHTAQHGTNCAGLVAMLGRACGIGINRGSRIAAIRLLSSSLLNDAVEGDALAFRNDMIDIYSISWGPKDDGTTAEKPQMLTQSSIETGATAGRRGLGNIYVWASGNGGRFGDNCAYDGYVSNEFTISFGVIASDGSPADYAEPCSSIISAVSGGDSLIKTTGIDDSCSTISGSSAAAAIGSGIISLAIQENPSLTQRDIQHLLIRSSSFESLNVTFSTNSQGFPFHPHAGFGLINADKLVNLAKTWKNVGKQIVCQLESDSDIFHMESCNLRVERVILSASVFVKNRGSMRIWIESPTGTRSDLLFPRKLDKNENLIDWKFVSTHFYMENASGEWRVHAEAEDPVKMEGLRLKITGIAG